MVTKSARTAPGSYIHGSPQNPRNVSVENNFVGGLKTEFTGLNFPENACTDTDNCVFSLIGDVIRRGGIDYETNATIQAAPNPTSVAISSYRWRNAGGDGSTELLVEQVGATLYFFQSSAATVANPLSTQILASTVDLNSFLVPTKTLLDTSTSNRAIVSSGNVNFTISTGLPISLGDSIVAQSGSNSMSGTVGAYNSGTGVLALSVNSSIGSGTFNSWNIFSGILNPNNPALVETTYADGNGYLFVYHPYCETFYCTFTPGTSLVSPHTINIKVRDFNGIPDGLGIGLGSDPETIDVRPSTISNEHLYNLLNQGWTNQAPFATTSPTNNLTTTNSVNGADITITKGIARTYTVSTVANFTSGAAVTIVSSFIFLNIANETGSGSVTGAGTLVSLSGTTMVVNVTNGGTPFHSNIGIGAALTSTSTTISTTSSGNTIGNSGSGFRGASGLYPSNSDIWWEFKNTSGIYSPSTTFTSVTPAHSPAPNGHFLFNAFTQDYTLASGISGLTAITTTSRCSTGAWFAGRVWYTGISASQVAIGDQPFFTWTENIYFSQVIQDPSQFGYCYQVNDPVNENFFNILPTDGGVITIPGTGTIYKLFPTNSGMLVFAQNGIWFITGGQSIGFSATDYSINKISNVQCISSKSFVNVLGMPVFWNQEGIYSVQQNQQQAGVPYAHGGLVTEPITVGTILSFYTDIPLDSKLYARGDYNPNTYILQWIYKSTQETGIADRYHFDRILNLNIHTKAFYPYTIANRDTLFVNDVVYMTYPSSIGGLTAGFKYLTTVGSDITFSEENDFTNYVDWFTIDSTGVNYTSFFTTGYKVHGKGYLRWMPIYIYLYLRNTTSSSYTIQGVWDYAGTSALGRTSILQTVVNFNPRFNMVYRRHKLRGHGVSLQMKVSSVAGQPFDIMGWSIPEIAGVGV